MPLWGNIWVGFDSKSYSVLLLKINLYILYIVTDLQEKLSDWESREQKNMKVKEEEYEEKIARAEQLSRTLSAHCAAHLVMVSFSSLSTSFQHQPALLPTWPDNERFTIQSGSDYYFINSAYCRIVSGNILSYLWLPAIKSCMLA